MRARTAAASPSRPSATSRRGDSGTRNAPTPYTIDGKTSTQNIQRHAGTPNQKGASGEPAR